MNNYNANTSDDLDYLADAGFLAVGYDAADTEWIRAKVRSRFGGSSFLTILASVLFLIMMTASLIVAVTPVDYPLERIHHGEPHASASVSEPADFTARESDEITKAAPAKAAGAPERKFETTASPEPLTAESMPVGRSKVSVPSKEREPFFAANVPVRFIAGYKVTEYATLYFRGQSYQMPTGLDASFNGDVAHIVDDENERPLHKMLEEALKLYGSGDYRACLYILNQIREVNKDDLNCAFYSGMCQYNLGRCKAAIFEFDQCLTDANNSFAPEAEYYRAVSIAQCGSHEDAVRMMRRIASEGGFYASRAHKWLDDFHIGTK